MTLICDFNSLPNQARHGAVSIGNFDGVHRGHAVLLQALRKMADEISGPAVVLTFDPHPATILRPSQAPAPLTSIERRAKLLEDQGVDAVVVFRPTMDLLGQTPDEFFSSIVQDKLCCRAMVEGPNFFFGKDRRGDIDVLSRLCDVAAIKLRIVEPFGDDGQMVSSTAIRHLISAGDVASANQLLTAPYAISGKVERGAGRGNQLGFPTANLHDISVLVPAMGVYSGHATIDAVRYLAAIHIGPNPTFGEGQCKVEVHLLDFQGDLYGRQLEVGFDEQIREIVKFSSVDDLRQQLQLDILQVRRLQPNK